MMMKHAPALASAVFFWWPILLFWGFHSILWIVILIPTGMVSFVGSVLLFRESGTDSARRYLLLPFCVDILAVFATGLLSFYYFRSFPLGMSGELWAFTLLMLAPCSAAVFYSIPKGGRVRETSMYLAIIISAYSVITAILLLYGGYLPMFGLLYLYWMFGMPIIGVLFLVNAWYWPHTTTEKTISEKG